MLFHKFSTVYLKLFNINIIKLLKYKQYISSSDYLIYSLLKNEATQLASLNALKYVSKKMENSKKLQLLQNFCRLHCNAIYAIAATVVQYL